MKYIFSAICLFIYSGIITCSDAQIWQPKLPYVPAIRQNSHDQIDRIQKSLLNGNLDNLYFVTDNFEVNLLATYTLKDKVDYLQYFIETNTQIEEKDKYKWLRGIYDLLYTYQNETKYAGLSKINSIAVVNAFEKAMSLDIAGSSIQLIVDENNTEVGNIITQNFAFQNNSGLETAKLMVVAKMCKQNPANTLKILSQYPNLPYTDSLIIKFAYLNPEELYNYASSSNALGKAIQTVDEPWVNLIATIANTNNGRYLFPFLDAIYNNKISASDVLSAIENDEAYYKLLVRVMNFYEWQKQQGKKPLSMDALEDKLRAKSVETYINTINALHDEKDLKIRFAQIKNLTPNELYYLTIMGEEEMYTSSFISGVYPKIIEGLGTTPTDSLFKMAHYAFYRKFIKMCANFNMLEDFLSKMDKPIAENLMKTFSSDLETYWSLEEAVDVADSYSSIKDVGIKRIIINEVEKNISENKKINNKKGIVVYSLLRQIFSAFDNEGKPAIYSEYEIPSITTLNHKDLKGETERINVQQFFYGDKDGKNVFSHFVNNFRSLGWRVVDKPYWVEVVSNGATPVTIYANKPLDEEKGLDDEAQQKLYKYLDSVNIFPTVVIHRGHSYYVKSSIKQITSYAQLVLLGSCGGYHSLAKVLAISPKAQIIASKQIGTGAINARLIEIIFENLKQGKDLNWLSIWKNLEQKFTNDKELKERFDDYIPPQKNLGALFIMAYYKAMDK
jgi:hypothetical protein